LHPAARPRAERGDFRRSGGDELVPTEEKEAVQHMAEATIEIRNPTGLHARPAATFVKAAAGFSSDVRVVNLTRNPEKSAAAKSVLGVLGLGVAMGHTIRISAEGTDADEAVKSLVELVASGLGEPVEP
jgi:phosphotransferase system HPr (HPr) family protein